MIDINALEERINALNESLAKTAEDIADVKNMANVITIDSSILLSMNNAIADYNTKVKELDDKISSKKEEILGLEALVKQLSLEIESQIVALNQEKQRITKQERIDHLNAFISSPVGEGTEFNQEILKAKSDALHELRSLDRGNVINFREKAAKLARLRSRRFNGELKES